MPELVGEVRALHRRFHDRTFHDLAFHDRTFHAKTVGDAVDDD